MNFILCKLKKPQKIWCIVNESIVTTTKACFRICAFRLSALFTLFLLLRKSLPWLVTLTTLISWTMSWLYAAYHKSGFNLKNLKPEFEFFFRKKNTSQRQNGFFCFFFVEVVLRVTKANQASPRSKMGRSLQW